MVIWTEVIVQTALQGIHSGKADDQVSRPFWKSTGQAGQITGCSVY